MTPGEYLASFVYWTRGPGNTLARRWFDKSDWQRLELYAPDGFFEQGQYTRYEKRVRQLIDERHIDRPTAEDAVGGVIVAEIFARFPAYLATMLPLAYRGIWCDEFILFGLPALIWLLLRSGCRRDWRYLATFAPGVYSLIVYPAVSLNMPRYQLPAVACLAAAAGVAAAASLSAQWMQWSAPRREAARGDESGRTW
jgi:hypothetical protein